MNVVFAKIRAEALAALGTVAARRGDWNRAVDLFGRAARSAGASARIHRELGEARRRSGDIAGAHDSLRTAVRLAPDDADALAGLAHVSFMRNEVADAASFAGRAVERRPDHPVAVRVLGRALARQGDFAHALALLSQSAQRYERDPSAWVELGVAQRQLSQLEEAQHCFERALALMPGAAELHVVLGELHLAAGRSSEAKQHFEEALLLAPVMTRARTRLASAAAQSGDAAEAERLLLEARDLDPGDLDSLVQLGELHHEAGRVDQALECYRRARALDPIAPEVHLHAALAHLHRGDLASGWEELEWRLRLPSHQHLQRIDKPAWQGEDPAGRAILIQAEPGVSDNVQFLRYAPLLAARGARVIVETHPELRSLVGRMSGIEAVTTGTQELTKALGSADFRCPLLSLPHRFRTTRETIPAGVPYLLADDARSVEWRSRLAQLSGSRKIGWTSDRRGALAELRQSAVAGTTFVRLDRDTDESEGIVDWTPELADFADVADLVAALDLVIGPANAITHLAGAMGKPTWILLPHFADWRWQGDAPNAWYPTARLFREPERGAHAAMLRYVAAELVKLRVT